MARVPTLPGEGEVLPRYVFLESMVPKARVLEIGAIALTGGHSACFLMERGAASVLSVDSDAETLSDRAAPAYRLFICGIEPTPLASSSLTPLASGVLSHLNARLESVLSDPLGLAKDMESEVDEGRIAELEARTQKAIEEAER